MSREKLFSYLGLKVIKIEKGYVETSLEYSENVLRIGGVLHGGAIMTTIDYTGGLATMTVNDGEDQVTQELKINFLEPMSNGPFRCVAKVVRAGRTAVVVEVDFFDKDGVLGAKALGTWYILRGRRVAK
ncbi:esterase [Stygiolobus caldivivus]|uniref:Esterase n=1 Tax=Stygiolobus caldivivus TaxID=2824673 RepID=A0A8D5ZJ44_9CREN|nr:esterase [Stygiolobus caldivivus]